MNSKKTKKNKVRSLITVNYPSAEMLLLQCFEDYKHIIDTYDKIYEKINTSLAFCGALLLVIVNNYDYTLFKTLFSAETNIEVFQMLVLLSSSTVSVICMLWAVIELLIMMRSKSIVVFDSVDVRNERIYRRPPDEAAYWLIEKYTYAVSELRDVTNIKVKKYDTTLVKVLISVIAFATFIIIKRGA